MLINYSPSRKHPLGLYILAFAEMWERFSYYGMRALLILFLTSALKFADTKAYGVFSVYVTLVWGASVFGGYIADHIIGFQRSILLGSIIIACGHLCLAIFNDYEIAIFLGLGFIATGTGFFKSNVSTMVGLLYPKDSPYRDAGFTIFYVFFNIGSFLSPIICGYIGHIFGWHYGFGVAGIGMLLGAITLFYLRHHFAEIGLPPKTNTAKQTNLVIIGGFLSVPILALMIYNYVLFQKILPLFGLLFIGYILFEAYKGSEQDKYRIFIIIIAMLILMVSGALIDQSATAINLFIDRNVDTVILGTKIPASIFQAVDPIAVISLGPIVALLWNKLSDKGIEIKATTKFVISFLLISLAFFILYFGCQSANQDSMVAVPFAILGMFILASSDILIYPIILSLCSQLAPKHLQGVMMGGVMLSIAFSQLFGGFLAQFASVPAESNGEFLASASLPLYNQLFSNQAWLAIALAILVALSGKWINKAIKEHT